MRTLSPASRGSFSLRLSGLDTLWALLTPPLALWVRDAPVLSAADWTVALTYCAISATSAVGAFLIFRVRDGMTPLFAVHDAIGVVKAVLLSELVTCLVLFTATRLDGVPRTTPLIHALLLAAGIIMARAWLRMTSAEAPPPPESAAEQVIVIGSNRMSSLYIELLQACAPQHAQVIGILDDRQEMAGRSLGGVRVLGSTLDLLPVIEEFKEHGISATRVVIGGNPDALTTGTDIRRICADAGIRLDYVPQLMGLSAGTAAPQAAPALTVQPAGGYFALKRAVELFLALLLLLLLLPLLLLVSVVVLLDVGSPVLFWQRRVGMKGRPFQMHKFRTMKPSYDWRGLPVPSSERTSWVGQLLRQFHLDELPQLLNVLVGDMSLIGPRPLLPQDQPSDAALRLSVRPGITGLAQVCGGTLLSPAEKNDYDEWYIRNAGLGLDLKILAKTLLVIFTGEQRDAHHLHQSLFPSRSFRHEPDPERPCC